MLKQEVMEGVRGGGGTLKTNKSTGRGAWWRPGDRWVWGGVTRKPNGQESLRAETSTCYWSHCEAGNCRISKSTAEISSFQLKKNITCSCECLMINLHHIYSTCLMTRRSSRKYYTHYNQLFIQSKLWKLQFYYQNCTNTI